MKRSRLLALGSSLGALYFATHVALAEDVSVPRAREAPLPQSAQPDTDSANDARETYDVISAIRTEVVVADKLANEFETLAGSHRNAQSLVVGLRNAKPVTMVTTMAAATSAPTKVEVSFTPPTRPMSFADIHKALSLAQAQLQSKHIDNPTPAQIKASLAGGELPNADGDITRVIGILPLHRRGMSWDQIARSLRLAPPKRMAAIGTPTTEM